MTRTDTLGNFVNLSNILGNDVAYVQGGGGNTSIKDENHEMIIKASGLTLMEVTRDYGYTVLDYSRIVDISADSRIDDENYNLAVSSSIIGDGLRPSMETGFHAALGPVVAHTHSVYVNILSCSKQGLEIVAEEFPNAIWIPYIPPGRDLTHAVLDHTESNVFFLQNHGIIISGASSDSVLQMHEDTNLRIREFLNLPYEFGVDEIETVSLEFMRNHILFPDQVIYTSDKNNLSDTQAGKETIAAYSYIHQMIKTLGFEPNYLKSSDADFLLNMDSEKYRQTVTRT